MREKKATDTQSRKYQLTINNPLDVMLSDGGKKMKVPFHHEEIKQRLSQLTTIQYWCMADEVGLKGETPHTHIFLYSRSPIRFSTVKNQFPTAHIESAYGSCQENKEYITKSGKWSVTDKSETSVEGTFEEWGTMPNHENKGFNGGVQYLFELMENGYSDADILRMYPEAMLHLDKIQRARATLQEDEVKNDWRNLNVTYIYGETNTGKTRSVMDKFGYANVYRITDYSHPWDSYRMQKVVLFEEFRSSMKIQDMLTYLDGYPCTLPARYANKQAGYTDVFITTNIPLQQQYGNVQEYEPETWAAFLRRIGKVQCFSADGSITTYDSVEAYFRAYSRRMARGGITQPIAAISLPQSKESISDDAFSALMPTDEKSDENG